MVSKTHHPRTRHHRQADRSVLAPAIGVMTCLAFIGVLLFSGERSVPAVMPEPDDVGIVDSRVEIGNPLLAYARGVRPDLEAQIDEAVNGSGR